MMTSKNDRRIQIRRRIKYLLFGLGYSMRHLYRFVKWGKCDYKKTQSYFINHIISSYHVIEKNLAMPDFEPGHGLNNLRILVGDLIEYQSIGYDTNHIQYISAVQCVFEYEKVHDELKYKLDADLLESISILHAIISVPEHHQPKVSSVEFFINSSSDFEKFAMSRHSVRAFSDKSIPEDILKKVFSLCSTTPTPCNRQPNKVYAVTNKNKIKQIVSLQGGGRGFAEKSNVILVITSTVGVFLPWEMNEAWKSAGMYAMNLLYALHYYRIGACPLVWSEKIKEDKQLRNLIKVSDNEEIAMLIAIGYPLDEFKYVTSTRNDYNESFVFVK